MRRVCGYHDIRLDGILDLTLRVKGASVLDLGCNRGLVSFELANNGAALVHGCDIDEGCIATCRGIFADLRNVESKFEILDLNDGGKAITSAFGERRYDLVLLLATYHKMARQMSKIQLNDFITYLGDHTERYFAWRGKKTERVMLDRILGRSGLRRIQFSEIATPDMEPAGIWGRM